MPKKICIAPGHGGFDPGCVGNGMMEKNITLAIGLALNKLLNDAEIPTVMTRTGDYAAGHATNVQADLDNECTIANNDQADLFVCVHVNCCGGHGSEVFIYSENGGAKEIASELVDQVGSLMGLREPAVKVDPGLWVLAHTNMPALLIEVGFIDNATDAELMRTHVESIAELMAKPLIDWANGKTTTTSTAPTSPVEHTTTINETAPGTPAASPAEHMPSIPAAEHGTVTINKSKLADILQQLIDLVSGK